MRDILVIMGSHPRTRELFDFTRQDCDVWVFNEAAKQPWAKKVDGVLQLHVPAIWRNPKNRNDPQHYDWLKNTDIPVFMQEKYEDVPASVKFPKDEILGMLPNARVNGKPIREVSCSPAWALAYGIYLGYKKIELYGIELGSDTEYHYQQGNFKYWLGVAAGRGIEVDFHSTMFDNPLYGYEGEVAIEYEEFTKRIDEVAPFKTSIEKQLEAEMYNLWNIFDKQIDADVSKELLEKVQDVIIIAGKLGEADGTIQENKRYLDRADTMKVNGGKFVFSRQEFEQGAAQSREHLKTALENLNMMKGQLEMVHAASMLPAKGSPKRIKQLAAYREGLKVFIKANNVLGLWKGVTSENMRYMQRLDAGIKAAGGVKSEEAING